MRIRFDGNAEHYHGLFHEDKKLPLHRHENKNSRKKAEKLVK